MGRNISTNWILQAIEELVKFILEIPKIIWYMFSKDDFFGDLNFKTANDQR